MAATDEKDLMMASTGKATQEAPPLQALKCPRCDSLNTKFCYYNNYSLSQPRHFCKACKRYWTKGGTIRNVPVGSGCRKNKRVKKGPASTSGANPNPPSQSDQIDVSSNSSNHINPLFYGLANDPYDMNLPFPKFNSRVSGVENFTGYDLQPQMNALGLGLSSGNIVSSDSNPLLSSYSNIFGSSSSSTVTTPTSASLLASTFHEHKFMNSGVKNTQPPPHFQTLPPFEDLQRTGNSENGLTMKDFKVEEAQISSIEWNKVPCQNQLEQTATSVGACHDQANIGSSVTSLI